MLSRLPLALCFLVTMSAAFGQLPGENDLLHKLSSAKDDRARIHLLGDLAELYSVYKDNNKADSILEKQMLLAEVSQDESLILQTISGNAIGNISTWSSRETFERALAFLQKALNYAKDRNRENLEAIIYLKKASLLRKRNLHDQAIEQVTFAFPLLNKKKDSLQAAFYLELGNAFLGKGDAVAAYKNYNSAYDIAYSAKNTPLLSAAWHHFADLYRSLGDSNLAKNALLESLELNRKADNQEGILADYIDLFRLTDAIEFLTRALFLADSLHLVRYQLYGKRLMLSYIMVVQRNSDAALAYLERHPDLRQYFANEGLPNYNIGAIYHYCGNYAEAVRHYLLDEPKLLKQFDASVQLSFYSELAGCYKSLGIADKAILFYEKAYRIGKTAASPSTNAALTDKLSQLYAEQNDYGNAYAYSQAYLGYSEELKALAKQREVTLLGLEREKRRHEQDLQAMADEELRRRNLQYTGISMATAFIFIVLLVFGMFPISRVTIRMLNFFSFICLFEFIILLIDNWLHHLAHGEPLKIWLAKIFIIALLMPLHHTLEHVAIRFLSSQKLQRFRKNISIKRLFSPSKPRTRKLKQTPVT